MHGFEPTLHVTVQGIIVAALEMGLVGLADEFTLLATEGSMTPPPIAAAIGHIEVRAKIIPATRKLLPGRFLGAQRSQHFTPAGTCKAAVRQVRPDIAAQRNIVDHVSSLSA
jgi:hypothetical protein